MLPRLLLPVPLHVRVSFRGLRKPSSRAVLVDATAGRMGVAGDVDRAFVREEFSGSELNDTFGEVSKECRLPLKLREKFHDRSHTVEISTEVISFFLDEHNEKQ